MSDDDKVQRLPVRFKKPLGDKAPILKVVHYKLGECSHRDTTYLICASETEVVCGRCNTRLSPLWVLAQLAHHEHRMNDLNDQYDDQMKRLAERSRTKCEHCGRMTRISRR